MAKQPSKIPSAGVANDDNASVAICFADREISELFQGLLSGHGVKASIVRSIFEVHPETKIITEAQFYADLSPLQARHSLIVGSPGAVDGLSAICLLQPLTESKIERAIDRFLSASV